jgi:dihydrofolate reductase
MGKLTYTGILSLDGYIADETGNFDWAALDEEVHAFVNDLERPIGTYLLGRRTYDVLSVWDTMNLEGEPAVIHDYAQVWRAANKIVYSTTLRDVAPPKTRIEREFNPAEVAALKQREDLSIGGPTLAAHAIKAGLVDEYHLFLTPVVVGGGTSFWPGGWRELDLLDEQRFTGGVVYLRYGASS